MFSHRLAAWRMSAQARLRPFVAPALVLTLGAGVATAAGWSGPAHPAASSRVVSAAPVVDATSAREAAVSALSAGAPAGALTLGVEPARAANPVPATPALIAALSVNGIPAVALNAYRVAAARIDSALPGCGIDWSLIAAIGRVESDHGQFGGAALQSDGTSSPKIIGPALNGVGFAFIADTDHGVLDGDPVFDRAVGPMQFIPSTWSGYAIDANGDGTASPFDINDASLAAAHYLCLAGGDLRSAAGQRRAVLAYNYSDAYLAEVLALASSYATGIPVTGTPTGITSGAVPTPSGNPSAPAAPGPAPAAYPAPATAGGHRAPAPQPATHPSAQPSQPAPSPGSGGAHPGPFPSGPVPGPVPAPTGPVVLPIPVPSSAVPTQPALPASPNSAGSPATVVTCGPLRLIC